MSCDSTCNSRRQNQDCLAFYTLFLTNKAKSINQITKWHICLEKIFGLTSEPYIICHTNPWKKCSSLMQFLKYLSEPFLRPLRLNDVQGWIFIETENDKNSKWKLINTRRKTKFGLGKVDPKFLSDMCKWVNMK